MNFVNAELTKISVNTYVTKNFPLPNMLSVVMVPWPEYRNFFALWAGREHTNLSSTVGGCSPGIEAVVNTAPP